MDRAGCKAWPATLWRLAAQADLRKITFFVCSLFLFILGIVLMKDGARSLSHAVRGFFAVTGPFDSLGFGWLFAYAIMSGSPVAASALTFFDAGIIDQVSTFTMITGSRLGASFIVLFIGFLYTLRGRDRATSLGMGLLSLIVTASTYLTGMALGVGILRYGLIGTVRLNTGALLPSIVDLVFGSVAGLLLHNLPRWSLFVIGLAVIVASLGLFDRCLPQMSIKSSQVGSVSRLVYRPWVMLLLGASVTLISMSVSLSLSILVPLSDRGFVRRENVIPYIMGANITTFTDTLFASVLIGNPGAVAVVLTEIISVSLVSIVVLASCYRTYERTILRIANWVTSSNRNLFAFAAVILAAPILLVTL